MTSMVVAGSSSKKNILKGWVNTGLVDFTRDKQVMLIPLKNINFTLIPRSDQQTREFKQKKNPNYSEIL